jgi:hypothetical protein
MLARFTNKATYELCKIERNRSELADVIKDASNAKRNMKFVKEREVRNVRRKVLPVRNKAPLHHAYWGMEV